MHYKKIRVEGDPDKLEVVTISDLHLGHPDCDMELVKRVIAYIKNNDNCRAVCLGDVIENSSKGSVGAAVYEQIINPQEQMDLAVELLEPIAHKIDLAVQGNHENRSLKDSGIDPMKVICDRLGIEYAGYMGIVDYTWNKKSYPVFIWHGNGSGSTAGTLDRKLKNLVRVAEGASIYVMGHLHKLFTTKSKVYKIDPYNAKVREEEIVFACTPSTVGHASYAQMMGLEPQQKGQIKFVLDGKKGKPKSVEIKLIE